MNVIETFDANDFGRDFAVGDLHGAHDLLMRNLERLRFDRSKDRLFCVGDLIDRGPDSEACVALLDEPWFFSVMGNHEQMMLEQAAHWFPNGGGWWTATPQDLRDDIMDKCSALPHLIQVGDVGIMHTDPPTGVRSWGDIIDMVGLSPEFAYACLWNRMRTKTGPIRHVTGIRRIICGHSVVQQPREIDNFLFIDTGAVFTGRMTFVDLATLEVRTL